MQIIKVTLTCERCFADMEQGNVNSQGLCLCARCSVEMPDWPYFTKLDLSGEEWIRNPAVQP